VRHILAGAVDGSEARRPEAYLLLLGDGLLNLLGGLVVGAAFVVDIRVGISAWFAAAAHEVPQELGDFAILVHGGFLRGRALFFNFVSALTFSPGGGCGGLGDG
jgi:zinc and cadmium transporter